MSEIGNLDEIWLEKRRCGIGGSDAAAILGESKFITNLDLWKIKTGKKEKLVLDKYKEFIDYGRTLEPVLIDLFEANNKDYEVVDKEEARQDKFKNFVYHKDYNFIFGNFDGIIRNVDTGELGILEIKTCQENKYNAEEWKDDNFPVPYYLQVLHYLNVSGYNYAVLFALINRYSGDKVIKTRTVLRKEVQAEMDFLLQKEITFWNEYVLKDVEPNLLIKLK